ncbi:hypothetical protein E4U40_006876 [Claviceps sp. LM458 group G5]|nr:hypothetical protein E4U40_006876 [Claviceps sp. LM458 group G5]
MAKTKVMERHWTFGDKGKGMRNESHLDAGYQRKRKAVERTPEERRHPSPAIVVVDEVELGCQLSTLHLTLWQGGQACRTRCLYWPLHESIPTAMVSAVPNFNLPKTVGTDGVWVKGLLPNDLIRKGSSEHWYMLIPRHGPLTLGVCDIWISATAGQNLSLISEARDGLRLPTVLLNLDW